MQEGKIEAAKEQARWLRGSNMWVEVVELFKPNTDPICLNGHSGVWSNTRGFTWSLTCETCVQEEHIKREVERLTWFAEIEARQQQQEAESRRTYRDRPVEELHEMLRQIGVPRRFLDATVKRMEPLTGSLYITGVRGTGKTHLAASIVREYVLGRRPYVSNVAWISVPDLLLKIRATFRDRSEQSESGIIEEYSDCRLLVLDDMGVEKTSEWSLQTLYTIIDRRYREERQTIITSNLSLDELAERLDDRIASRLSELCRVVVLTGPDRRTQRKNKS
jgi:DNA replication protein DnaC